MAFGVVAFLSPNNVATGGTAGLSILLHHLIPISIGLWMLLINIPLLLMSLKTLGKPFAIRTIITILLISFFVDVFTYFVAVPALSKNLLLATLYGGLFVGLGLGCIFKGEASAGGASIVAKLIALKTGFKPGYTILILDAFIVVFAGFVFKNIELALWSLIGIYVSSKIIDVVLTGNSYDKIVHISSENLIVVQQRITKELGISGTLIKGKELEMGTPKDLILLVIENNRISILKRLVEETDPNAFMIVMEASELLSPSNKKI